ncbi:MULTISPECIES: adenylyl-sulfate kinase [unclassified Paenibacillus]|uniref:adenylyl-sulfate kinase n=1 Tax=unclassified Paenibacillus TaxID=185978 RepID=UPI000A6B6D6B|nr:MULTISPECIES: adenylyl-sulfate kinase [unclassified Paenibacillus]
MQKGVTVWFTGLSGAGKTTICRQLENQLQDSDLKLELLDGDEIRRHFSSNVGFSKEDRMTHIQRMAYISKLLTRNGVLVLASFITPYKEMRDYLRTEIGSFLEVYVKCPLDECIQRDVKGLYAKALNGDIKQFTGISDPYEEPESPDLIIETDKETVKESAMRVIAFLKNLGYISN